jgi:hypothetical protein
MRLSCARLASYCLINTEIEGGYFGSKLIGVRRVGQVVPQHGKPWIDPPKGPDHE